MGKIESLQPAKPIMQTEAVRAHLPALQRRLADLRAQVPGAALKSACGDGASLATLEDAIRLTAFEIDCQGQALAMASVQDEEAIRVFRARTQALPIDTILEGLTKEQCCHRCIPGIACAITGSDPLADKCAHVVIVGPLELARYEASPTIKKLYRAACEKLNVRPRT